MVCIAVLEGKNHLDSADIEQLIIVAALVVCSTHHTILGYSLEAAVFGQDMLFDLPYLADRRQ